MRVDLDAYLPAPRTVVYRVDAADAGADEDVLRAHTAPDALFTRSAARAVGTTDATDTEPAIVQIPAPSGYMPYREFVAAGCPAGAWTARPGDRVLPSLPDGPLSGAWSDDSALAVVSVRDLDRDAGMSIPSRRGAMRYARATVLEVR